MEKKNSFPFGDFTEKIAPKGKKNQSENDKTDSFSGGLFRKPLHKKAASFAEYEAMQKANNPSYDVSEEANDAPAPKKNNKKTASAKKKTQKKKSDKTAEKKTPKKAEKKKSQPAKLTPNRRQNSDRKGQGETGGLSKNEAMDSKEIIRSVHKKSGTPLKIIPLGGLNEIGKNFTVFEYENDMFIVDCGLAFPDTELYGVDIVIPDFTYVEQNSEKLRGIVITHGHEDHIGGLSYLLKKIKTPVYATKLTIGLIEGKLKEHQLLGSVELNVIKPRQTVKMGCMAVEFVRVNHSIPDACGFAVHTPAGIVVHTGDFKVDYTPIEGGIIDLARFGELGSKGVIALMSDSTNSERSGCTASEKTVGQTFVRLFDEAEGKRIIIATFSSNIHRIQQVVDCAVRFDRKVAVSGRSMINVISKAIELGYLSVPDGIIIDIDLINKYPPEKIVIVTTGSQGEAMSALTRMSTGEHRKVSITPMDYIIISANPIPGNEKYVTKVVNDLMRLGATVIYESMYDVHVSGHACQDEQKLIMALTRPKYFIPVHGEYKHLRKHADTAIAMGIPEENIIIGNNGDVIEVTNTKIAVSGKVTAGRIFVDGSGVGDVGSIVLRDRKRLAEDGQITVVATIDFDEGTILAGPDVYSRGFVYVRESEELMAGAKRLMTEKLEECLDRRNRDRNMIRTALKDALSDYIFEKTKRSPMISPIIQEI